MDHFIECNNIVTGRQQAIQCEQCDLWQHRMCGTGVTLQEYRDAMQNGLEWVCGPCLEAANAEEPEHEVRMIKYYNSPIPI